METKKSIIISYSAPSREHLWLNPSNNALKYFNGQEWIAIEQESTNTRIAETTTGLSAEMQSMSTTIEDLQNKLNNAEQSINMLKTAIVELSAIQNTQQIDEAA